MRGNLEIIINGVGTLVYSSLDMMEDAASIIVSGYCHMDEETRTAVFYPVHRIQRVTTSRLS